MPWVSFPCIGWVQICKNGFVKAFFEAVQKLTSPVCLKHSVWWQSWWFECIFYVTLLSFNQFLIQLCIELDMLGPFCFEYLREDLIVPSSVFFLSKIMPYLIHSISPFQSTHELMPHSLCIGMFVHFLHALCSSSCPSWLMIIPCTSRGSIESLSSPLRGLSILQISL